MSDPKNRLVAAYMGTIEFLRPGYLLIEQVGGVVWCSVVWLGNNGEHSSQLAAHTTSGPCGCGWGLACVARNGFLLIQSPWHACVCGGSCACMLVCVMIPALRSTSCMWPALMCAQPQVTDIYKKEEALYARFSIFTMLQHGYQARAGILTAGFYGTPEVGAHSRQYKGRVVLLALLVSTMSDTGCALLQDTCVVGCVCGCTQQEIPACCELVTIADECLC